MNEEGELIMSLGFVPSPKRGQHYDLALFANSRLKGVNLFIKGQSESHFERTIVSHLQASPKLRSNLITQIDMDEVEKITKANLFGFTHRPDVSIGNDGTAIEIKVISTGQSIRDLLGQAIAYRMHYRFVILVIVDQTEDRKVVDLCRSKKSQEYSLLSGLAEVLNIYTVVGPVSQSKNLVFFN